LEKNSVIVTYLVVMNDRKLNKDTLYTTVVFIYFILLYPVIDSCDSKRHTRY
jgi:hypothetical protein